MRTFLIGVAWLWLAAAPSAAQMPGRADIQAAGATRQTEPRTAPPSPTRQTPTTDLNEISHQAMVEEQERRDREEQAERDRDDQG